MTPELPPLAAPRARELVGAWPATRLLVVGDVMLDQFIVGTVSRISPEAPVPVVAFDHDDYRAGGAANVAVNVRALGAGVELIGLVGADPAARRLVELLQAADLGPDGLLTDDRRRTTTKVRIVTTRNQQVARVDYETDETVAPELLDALVAQIDARAGRAGAIVVSDYLKGIVGERLMAALVAASRRHHIPLIVDPKIPHLDLYAGATLVTPNHHEAEIATHSRIRTDEEARRAGGIFRDRARCQDVLITRGEQGMWLAGRDVEGRLPAVAREVADVTGAGDTVVALLALALAAGASAAEAARLANEAAGLVVGKFGPATVSPTELAARFR